MKPEYNRLSLVSSIVGGLAFSYAIGMRWWREDSKEYVSTQLILSIIILVLIYRKWKGYISARGEPEQWIVAQVVLGILVVIVLIALIFKRLKAFKESK